MVVHDPGYITYIFKLSLNSSSLNFRHLLYVNCNGFFVSGFLLVVDGRGPNESFFKTVSTYYAGSFFNRTKRIVPFSLTPVMALP